MNSNARGPSLLLTDLPGEEVSRDEHGSRSGSGSRCLQGPQAARIVLIGNFPPQGLRKQKLLPPSRPQGSKPTNGSLNAIGRPKLRRWKLKQERERKTHPAKKAATVKVAYKAEFELEFTPESTLPAAPRPFKELNEPGQRKHTKPSKHTWVTG